MDFEVLPAFVTPIYCGRVDDYDEIQSELGSCIENIDFGMVSGWGSTHYLSDPTFNSNLVGDFGLDKFAKEIDKHVENYCQQINFNKGKYKITSSWFALFKKGNYAHIHNHGSSDIAGVYYFKKSGDDGNLFFCTPNKAVDTGIIIKNGRMVVNPSEGDFLLFPGWLDHGVQTNDTDDERVSVSFNIRFEDRK